MKRLHATDRKNEETNQTSCVVEESVGKHQSLCHLLQSRIDWPYLAGEEPRAGQARLAKCGNWPSMSTLPVPFQFCQLPEMGRAWPGLTGESGTWDAFQKRVGNTNSSAAPQKLALRVVWGDGGGIGS